LNTITTATVKNTRKKAIATGLSRRSLIASPCSNSSILLVYIKNTAKTKYSYDRHGSSLVIEGLDHSIRKVSTGLQRLFTMPGGYATKVFLG